MPRIIPASGVTAAGSASTPRLALPFASFPPAASNVGLEIRATDVGAGSAGTNGGTILVASLSRWRGLAGAIILDAIDTANSGTTGTAIQQLNPNHASWPAGLTTNGDRFQGAWSLSKNGTSDTATFRLHIGPLGTTADPVILTVTSVATTNQSFQDLFEFKRISATSIQFQGNQTFKGASPSAIPAPITVGNLDAAAQFITISGQMTGGTEIPTVNDYRFWWLPTDV